ncbi:MAG: CinA family protein [Planctomycetes bacterium]|nr:CinA family protein [Planctomycetota bacterium]
MRIMPAERVAELLKKHNRTVATAESCTGGLIAKLLTDIPGSSEYFIEGVVAYANQAKTRLLGVPTELITEHGAVSQQVAAAMALGCRAKSGADFALSTTGIAGPTGGTPEKPIGLVYIALADEHGCHVEELRLDPTLSRDEIRRHASEDVLRFLETRLTNT